jgi:hypothetical protein
MTIVTGLTKEVEAMQPWAWVLLVVVVVVLAVAVWAAARQRRSASLRERFGPEYDRTVEAADDRRGAEQTLLDRARRRDRLNIVALPEEARSRYAGQWRDIQERFIDDPAGSVGSAHNLLDQVMAERGYPTRDFEEQADLVSVDHPQVVADYRAAYAVYSRQREGQAGTEDLREALVRYRLLFEELLRPEGGGDDRRAHALADTRTDSVAATRADGAAETRADGAAETRADGAAETRADDTAETRADAVADDRADDGTGTRADDGTTTRADADSRDAGNLRDVRNDDATRSDADPSSMTYREQQR